MAKAKFTLAELPAGSADLYTVSQGEAGLGIGTPDELRSLVAEGVLPPADELTFRLEWAA